MKNTLTIIIVLALVHFAIGASCLVLSLDFSAVDGEVVPASKLKLFCGVMAAVLLQPLMALEGLLPVATPDWIEWLLLSINSLLWGAAIYLLGWRFWQKKKTGKAQAS